MQQAMDTTLMQIETLVWAVEDRQLAIEATLTALVLSLLESGQLGPHGLQQHLHQAGLQLAQAGEPLQGARAELDKLRQHLLGQIHEGLH